MMLRKREHTGTWKRKHYITLCGELDAEEAMILLKDGLHTDEDINYVNKYPIMAYSKIKTFIVIMQFKFTYTPYYQTITKGSGTEIIVSSFIQQCFVKCTVVT
jgi:hypothetical protein